MSDQHHDGLDGASDGACDDGRVRSPSVIPTPRIADQWARWEGMGQ